MTDPIPSWLDYGLAVAAVLASAWEAWRWRRGHAGSGRWALIFVGCGVAFLMYAHRPR